MRAFALALMIPASLSFAQDFAVPLPKTEEIVPVEVIDPRPSIEGIVKEIFVTKKPWQMINPAAPAKFGSGERMVSKDFGPGTPVKSSGLIVASVEW
jgi:hypothetical protein